MCGIAGWYRRGNRPVSPATLVRQCDAIRHRGPDDSGYITDGDMGMGMRRLSIIDLAGGHQPMETHGGRFTIIANGEIYNHLELRSALVAKGYCFNTHSDTETLLAAYATWGDEAWLRLEGMYAVAIWDRQSRTLTLARDPLGIKPLYITEQHGGIAFASELKALLVLPGLEFDIDERAVHDFFRFGHIQPPRCIYRQARQLDPGHVLHVGPSGEASIHQFWKPRIRVRQGLSESEWIEETRAQVLRSVASHMLADVPVGVFLSGGVDSSAITAAMVRQSSQRLTAFTVGFPGNRSDETAAAAKVARHLGCEHSVLPVELRQTRDVLPEILSALDEPLAASAVVPCWYLSKLAAEQVKVVLCGEGGDEIFARYKRQRNAMQMERWLPLIRALGPLASWIGNIPVTSSRKWNYVRQQIQRVRNSTLLDSGFQRFIYGTEISTPALREQICQPEFLRRQERPLAEFDAEYFADPDWRKCSMLEQFMLGDLTVHMPGAILPRLDRISMAHSLEARVPFLSHRFVDWSLTVPGALKLKGKGKHILREAIRPWLPAGILERPKQGLQMPLADWFLGDFSEFARETWHDSGAASAGYLNPDAVEVLFDEHRSGRANHGKLLYGITVFSHWWRTGRYTAKPADP